METHGQASTYVDAPADLVFGIVTDLGRLPAWNSRMTGVVELPPKLTADAEWVVGMRLMGRSFNSRSVVLEYDQRRRRFAHRSKPDDDNPSSTVWRWEVSPEGDGSRVKVSWDLQPVTTMRRLVAAPVRSRQIPRHDVPDSLAALARECERARPRP
jgi:uncharacterized membrane protein